jgi:hypothetical protein
MSKCISSLLNKYFEWKAVYQLPTEMTREKRWPPFAVFVGATLAVALATSLLCYNAIDYMSSARIKINNLVNIKM